MVKIVENKLVSVQMIRHEFFSILHANAQKFSHSFFINLVHIMYYGAKDEDVVKIESDIFSQGERGYLFL